MFLTQVVVLVSVTSMVWASSTPIPTTTSSASPTTTTTPLTTSTTSTTTVSTTSVTTTSTTSPQLAPTTTSPVTSRTTTRGNSHTTSGGHDATLPTPEALVSHAKPVLQTDLFIIPVSTPVADVEEPSAPWIENSEEIKATQTTKIYEAVDTPDGLFGSDLTPVEDQVESLFEDLYESDSVSVEDQHELASSLLDGLYNKRIPLVDNFFAFDIPFDEEYWTEFSRESKHESSFTPEEQNETRSAPEDQLELTKLDQHHDHFTSEEQGSKSEEENYSKILSKDQKVSDSSTTDEYKSEYSPEDQIASKPTAVTDPGSMSTQDKESYNLTLPSITDLFAHLPKAVDDQQKSPSTPLDIFQGSASSTRFRTFYETPPTFIKDLYHSKSTSAQDYHTFDATNDGNYLKSPSTPGPISSQIPSPPSTDSFPPTLFTPVNIPYHSVSRPETEGKRPSSALLNGYHKSSSGSRDIESFQPVPFTYEEGFNVLPSQRGVFNQYQSPSVTSDPSNDFKPSTPVKPFQHHTASTSYPTIPSTPPQSLKKTHPTLEEPKRPQTTSATSTTPAPSIYQATHRPVIFGNTPGSPTPATTGTHRTTTTTTASVPRFDRDASPLGPLTTLLVEDPYVHPTITTSTYRPTHLYQYHAGAPSPPLPPYVNPQIPPQYTFEYAVLDKLGGNFFGHAETKEGYDTKGRYFVHLPDGRLQTVSYYANQTGYFPHVVYSGDARYGDSVVKYPLPKYKPFYQTLKPLYVHQKTVFPSKVYSVIKKPIYGPKYGTAKPIYNSARPSYPVNPAYSYPKLSKPILRPTQLPIPIKSPTISPPYNPLPLTITSKPPLPLTVSSKPLLTFPTHSTSRPINIPLKPVHIPVKPTKIHLKPHYKSDVITPVPLKPAYVPLKPTKIPGTSSHITLKPAYIPLKSTKLPGTSTLIPLKVTTRIPTKPISIITTEPVHRSIYNKNSYKPGHTLRKSHKPSIPLPLEPTTVPLGSTLITSGGVSYPPTHRTLKPTTVPLRSVRPSLKHIHALTVPPHGSSRRPLSPSLKPTLLSVPHPVPSLFRQGPSVAPRHLPSPLSHQIFVPSHPVPGLPHYFPPPSLHHDSTTAQHFHIRSPLPPHTNHSHSTPAVSLPDSLILPESRVNTPVHDTLTPQLTSHPSPTITHPSHPTSAQHPSFPPLHKMSHLLPHPYIPFSHPHFPSKQTPYLRIPSTGLHSASPVVDPYQVVQSHPTPPLSKPSSTHEAASNSLEPKYLKMPQEPNYRYIPLSSDSVPQDNLEISVVPPVVSVPIPVDIKDIPLPEYPVKVTTPATHTHRERQPYKEWDEVEEYDEAAKDYV